MNGWEILTRELTSPHPWQLGGGGEAVWSPPSPRYLDLPGFRDPAYFRGHPIDPVFAVSLLDSNGRWISTRASSRRWNPAKLELRYTLPQALIVERRTLLSSDAFVSQMAITIAEESARDCWLVLWTRRPANHLATTTEIEANPQGISFVENRWDDAGDAIDRWACAYGTNFDADSWTVDHAPIQCHDLEWPTTPLTDIMTRSGLPGHFPAVDRDSDWLWFALAYPFSIAPGDPLKVAFVAAFGHDVESARANLESTVARIDPIQTSEEDWITWLEEVPSFQCSDPILQKAYWHRIAMRKTWRLARRPADPPLQFDAAIETAWRHDQDEVLDDATKLLNWPGVDPTAPASILLRRLTSIHPNDEFLAYLTAAADAAVNSICQSELRSSRDPDATEMTATSLAHNATQERAPHRGSLRRASFGLDLIDLLASFVPPDSRDTIDCAAQKLRNHIRQTFWSADASWFLEPLDLRLTQTLHGLLPLLNDAVEHHERDRIVAQTADPENFWTALPFPGISRRDSSFQPDSFCQRSDVWKNGRVCPEMMSLAIEALGHRIELAPPTERIVLATRILAFARSTFIDGDQQKPATFDHYHPLTGRGSEILGPAPPKGWLADHIIRFIAGLRPTDSKSIIVDPLPSALEWFKLDRVLIGDNEVAIEWDNRSGLALYIDEKPTAHAPVGHAIALDLSELCLPWHPLTS